jgi:hypothetical protein
MGCLSHGVYDMIRIAEIGEGGLMLSTTKPSLVKGDCIVVSFIIPGRGGVVARGEVLYKGKAKSQEIQYGVRFTRIGFEEKRLIREFVSQRKRTEAA